MIISGLGCYEMIFCDIEFYDRSLEITFTFTADPPQPLFGELTSGSAALHQQDTVIMTASGKEPRFTHQWSKLTHITE